MLKSTRALLFTLLLSLTMALSPVLYAQEAPAEDNMTRNLLFGAAAVIILIVYLKRRGKRKSGL